MCIRDRYKADGPLTKLLLMVVAIDDAVGLVLFSASYGVANALEPGRIDPMSVVLEPLLAIALSLALGAAAGYLLNLLEAVSYTHLQSIMCLVTRSCWSTRPTITLSFTLWSARPMK